MRPTPTLVITGAIYIYMGIKNTATNPHTDIIGISQSETRWVRAVL
jgi:hypothetical protein